MATTFPVGTFIHEFHADNRKNFNKESYGAEICQNQTSLNFISRILEEQRPDAIIEIGTFSGGLSILFGQYGFLKGIPVHTFDIEDKRQNSAIFDALGIHFHVTDCFSTFGDALIKSLLTASKRAFVFCDGGNKIREFNYYSDLLKSGDVICCHDYAPDRTTFERDCYLKSWGWCEITHADIADAIMRNNLVAVQPQIAQVAALGVYMKP